MKALSIISGLLLSFSLFSQVEIREFSSGQEVGNDISGTTVSVSVSGNGSVSRVFSIKNMSGSAVDLKISRSRLNTPPAAWIDGLSWAPNPDPNFEGMCFAGAQMSTNPWLTPNSCSVDDQNRANLTVEIYVEGPGCGYYRYYVMEDQSTTPIDSIDIEVCYNAGINESEAMEMVLYPNPTADVVTLGLPFTEIAYGIQVYDVRGTVVSLPSIMNHTLDFSAVLNGVYTIMITDEQGNSARRQLVVNH